VIGSGKWLRRLYRMRLGSGLVLGLPVVLVVGWYAWSAFAQVDRYRRAVESAPALDLELFQLALHDEIERDLRRLMLPERPAQTALPTFEVSLTRANLDALNARRSKEGKDSYVAGLLRTGGEVHEARLRYRGGQHWHWLMPQKSMKVRLDSGDLVDGARVFNLINDPTPFGMEDQIVLDLARERGILAPEYGPVWVRLNNTDMGVYRYEAQPDEGLLRRNRRVPGSLYSGDAEEGRAASPLGLFASRSGWQKVASRSEAEADDFRELDALLEAVARSSHLEFAAFADARLDLDRYALFDALDVVFGGDEHDYLSNHRFYVDPNSGRFEPVAWSFHGFQNEPGFNAVDHPLLIRLKFTPGYLARRNRLVYQLLTGPASVPAIRGRVDDEFVRLAPELAADPYWDAYKLLPRASRFHRFMVRPMSRARWVTSAQSELDGYARRVRSLLDALEAPGVEARWRSGERGAGRVEIAVDGEAAWTLREVSAGEGECGGRWEIFADVDGNGELDRARDPRVGQSIAGSATVDRFGSLTSGARLVPRPDASAKRGRLRVAAEPRTYTFFVGTQTCSPRQLTLGLESEVTGAWVGLRPLPWGEPPPPTDPGARAEAAPQFVQGERSPHPWSFPARPAPELVRLGPGAVTLSASREFGEHQSVVIAAGTRLALGPDVTLTFRGRVTAVGTARQPIAIAGTDPSRPFGGIILRGAGTQGSTLEWVQIEGGSGARGWPGSPPRLLDVVATSSVRLSHMFLRSGPGAEEILHAAHVSGLQLEHVTVADAPQDGVDLEFSSGELKGVRVLHAADDCLDLMGVSLRVQDSAMFDCGNNGVSVGEESQVEAHRLLVAGSRTGVLAKNGSHAQLTDSAVVRTRTALQTKGRERYYPAKSTIQAENLHALDCGGITEKAAGTTLEAPRVRTSLDGGGAAERWLKQMLRVESLDPLEVRLAAVKEEGGTP
jgi:CotH kinase protein